MGHLGSDTDFTYLYFRKYQANFALLSFENPILFLSGVSRGAVLLVHVEDRETQAVRESNQVAHLHQFNIR